MSRLYQGGAEGLALQAQLFGRGAAAILHGHGALDFGFGLGLVVRGLLTQFAPHLPAHPQKQEAARQKQADDGQKLNGDQRQADAQDDGDGQADQDGLAALFLGQGGGGQAHGHGVVAGQDEVDHQHLAEGGGLTDQFGIGEEVHAGLIRPDRTRAKSPQGELTRELDS